MKNVNLITFVSLLITPLLAFTSSSAVAQNTILETPITSSLTFDDDFLTEDEAFAVSFEQQKGKLTISFDIASDYYLYRHRFKFESEQLVLSPIELPMGVMHQDEYFGVQQVYKEDLSFILEFENVKPGATINVTYQGCATKGLCYQPKTKTVMIDEVHMKEKTINSHN